jgi:integrase
VSLYKQKGSEVWWASISIPGRSRLRRSTGETDRPAAQRVHDELKAQYWRAVPDARQATWGQAVAAWIDAKPRSTSELLSLKKFTLAHGDCGLEHVTRESVHKALSFCKTAGTYTRYRTMIAAILHLAQHAGQLDASPRLATKTDKKAKPRRWLTPAEWELLYNALPTHMRPMAKFAIETGLRQANVLQLRWDHVDLGRQLVWIDANDAKGGKAIAVPLNDAALAVLQALATQAPHKARRERVARPASPHVFTYCGRPIKEVKTAFATACRKAGIEGFTWHGFRHTWTTWHMQNGTPSDVLQKLGAWSDPRMVANYAHHSPTYLAGFVGNNRKKT